MSFLFHNMRKPVRVAIALVLLAVIGCQVQEGRSAKGRIGEKTMMEENVPSTPAAGDQATQLKGRRIPIRPAQSSSAPPPAKPAGGGGGYLRPYANESRNSRIEMALPDGIWHIKWRVELENELGAFFILQDNDRILMAGTYQWILYDIDGRLLRKGPMGGGEALFDHPHALFYAPDPSDMIAAYDVKNGKTVFAVNGYPGKNYARALIARRGRLLLNVSSGTTARPRAYSVFSETGIQVIDIGDRQEVDESDILQNATVYASDSRPTFRLPSAMHNDTLVMAFKDRVQFVDLHLNIQAELVGEFEPQAISLDETGRVYMIVRTQGKRSLWIVTPQGERVTSLDLAPADAASPPIVGYDHRVYLVDAGRVWAISPEGKLLWDRALGGRIGGAVVTGDDQLLVASVTQVISFDARGKPTVLFTLDGERLQTPPALTVQGELLVASQRHLYSLVATPPNAH